ncbi:hypothetical protein KAFR_0B06510 [Kazachstania africana CBS 2517]|uniref:Alcohol acetyltransferase n=1 Tax=Kazachstania africana (strain ATCC 22294 / BCRC 22015 / CBS 2517 / CECT 1963 / NBRC 1671 / NRRL Y-8276) TaxID=1071382 RepID=H2ARE7_KAZAF|nr:hypothetical protein KAFR_0B06510 [Kazachstania africana CBS 2517]CCF56947.1 hypothetical protein KAFR_0B06510 [Kazachstania africana CBS 2517]
MTLRTLSSYERKILDETIRRERNGVIFTASYSASSEEWGDDTTLLTLKDSRPTIAILTKAIQRLISRHVELFTTINENYEFEILKSIKKDDILNILEFDSYKDEKINCHNGCPPYLLRHIFDNNRFVPGSKKPLWSLHIIDESLVIFHGQDMLFDIFSAANFHKLLLKETNIVANEPLDSSESDIIFSLENSIKKINNLKLSKSIYDNPRIHLPATSPDLFNLQTQSFFKSVFHSTVKKPIHYLVANVRTKEVTSDNTLSRVTTVQKYTDIFDYNTTLNNTTVFGKITRQRYEYLNSLITNQRICFKSFMVGIIMLCLKPSIENFEGSMKFSIVINLRPFLKESNIEFGLFYKDVLIDVPLSLIDDNAVMLSGYRDFSDNDPDLTEKILEFQFKRVTSLVKDLIERRISKFSTMGFNDDDIRQMKYGKPAEDTKIIRLFDTSEVSLGSGKRDGKYILHNTNFTKSLRKNDFFSVSYTLCDNSGLNLCLQFPDDCDMEAFVECFQSFIE